MMTSQASNDRDDNSVESGLHSGSSRPPRLPCLLSVNSTLLAALEVTAVLRKVSRKKVAVLLDFVQMRRVGTAVRALV